MEPGLTLLVDASSLIYRALFAVPDTISTRAGTPINAAYGFLGMLTQLVADHDPDYIACASDEDWRPTWRVELIDSYKAQRAEPGSAQEHAEERLAPQMPVLFALLKGCGIEVVGLPDYEAEDIIGTLAARAPGRVAIVSGDRDLFQLVRDPDIYVLYPRRGVTRLDIVNESYIEEHYHIPGRAYRDFAVLRGDPSDGLPGVRGIGEKLATALVARYGSIDAILEAAAGPDQSAALSKVRRDLDYVKRAIDVVTIPTDLPLGDVDLTRPRPEPDESVTSLADENGLGGAVRRLVAALNSRA